MKPMKRRRNRFSISEHGARIQFVVAIALISVLPILTLTYLFQDYVVEWPLSGRAWLVAGILVAMNVLGYAVLLKYPRTIARLRRHMNDIARGELPETVDLFAGESDITALEERFNLIIRQMKQRIDTIEKQRAELIDAERLRVMTESLCTACHYLGQPATTITIYLELMKDEHLSADGHKRLAECMAEAEKMREIFDKLKSMAEYRTTPYVSMPGSGLPESSSLHMIDIESARTTG